MYRVFLYIILLVITYSYTLAFQENKGQWDSSVLFMHKTADANYWICKDKIVYDSYTIIKDMEDSLEISGFSSFVSFSNYNPNYLVSMSLDRYSNIIGKVKYDTVTFKNYYNNIDLRIFEKSGNLRFDFICKLNANPSDIELNLPENSIDIIENSTAIFKAQQSKYHLVIDSLKAYTESFKPIDSYFYKEDNKLKIGLNKVPKEPYTIDPIIFSTFLGGSSYEYARDVTVYHDYIYTVGYSNSKDFPTHVGAYSEVLSESEAGDIDIVISKFNKNGDSLLSSTYFGSYFNDYAESICMDSLGNVYLTGYFESNSTFPYMQGTIDTLLNAGFEGYVACFDSNLNTLKHCTLISGESDDFPQKVKYNNKDKTLIVAGYTYSKSEFPKSDTKHFSKISKKSDAFLLIMDTNLNTLKSSAIWGGEDDDFCHDFICTNNLLTTIGYSLSNDYPIVNSPDTITNTDSLYGDAFISQINFNTLAFSKSLLLSGLKKDIAYSISSLSDSVFSIAGYTESIDFPVTDNSFDTLYSNGISLSKGDAFVGKFDIELNPIYITFFGGAETDRAFDCGHDSKGNTYIVGSTYSVDLPIKGPYLLNSFADTSGNSDAYIAKISSDGSNLLYSTFLGGSKIDIAKTLFVQDDDYLIVAGWTSSTDFPITELAYDTLHNNNNMADIFLLKTLPSRIEFDIGNLIFLCEIDTLSIHAELYDFDIVDSMWWTPNYNITETNSLDTKIFPDSSITYTLYVRDIIGFVDSASIDINIIEFPEKSITGMNKVKPNIEYEYSVSQKDFIIYNWEINAGEIISKRDSNSILVKWDNPNEGYLALTYNTDYGCIDSTDIYYVSYDTVVKPTIKPLTKTRVCKGQPVIFDAGAGYKAYQWSTGATSRYDTVFSAGLYWAVLKDNSEQILFTDTVFVILLPLPQIPSVLVNGDELKSSEEDLIYQWYLNGIAIENAQSLTYYAKESGFYQVELTNKNNCTNISDSLYVTVTGLQEEERSIDIIQIDDYIEIASPFYCTYSIYDILGHIIFYGDNSKSKYYDLKILPAGIYFIQVYSEHLNQMHITKIVNN